MQDELLLDWRKRFHTSSTSVYSGNTKNTVLVNTFCFSSLNFTDGHREMAAGSHATSSPNIKNDPERFIQK
jgi:hypothetical protein